MKIRFIIIALSLMSLNAHAQKYHYDVNNDGHVTVSDIMLIVNKILGKADDEPEYPISVNVSQRPYADSEAGASGKLKSPVTTTKSLATDPGHFYVDYSYFSRSDEYDSSFAGTDAYVVGSPEYKTYWVDGESKWVVGTVGNSGEGHWPSNVDLSNDVIPFYAYANYETESAHFEFEAFEKNSPNEAVVSKPRIHFQVDENSSMQKDLLVAKTSDTYRRDGKTDGFLSFTFDHACAAVQFFLSKTEKLANSTIKVKGVKLHNVFNDGYYYFNANGGDEGNQEWAKLGYKSGNSSTYTLADNVTEINVTEDYTVNQLSTEQEKENKFFFMIPQTTAPWYTSGTTTPGNISEATGAYIELENCTIAYSVEENGVTKSYSGKAYIPFAVTWVKGTKHKVNIQIGTGLRDANGDRIFDADGVLIKTTTVQ